MRVLGIDPGSRLCGFGVVDETRGGMTHIECGGIAPPARADLGRRLSFIYDEVTRLIAEFQPAVAAFEQVIYAQNVKSALVLGQARGAALLAVTHAGLPMHEYTPTQIKKAVTGYGRADKNQVAMMIQSLLNLPEPAMADASDALAAAVCHLSSYRYLAQTTEAP
ncbi:MAG: crossover junction endodeoxyribonuclease RuvC [Deltaproteobacteria bacterium]|nr:crossover junction endodeoxyribonuclease RuvC [bacterium]MCB9476548.1 crossover junction endodeoxyribonuclease RuvC [Deltaproteobacteria bacterium]MCB9489474.1 crossover junction endodeoxyribonuclease RuvC [Deltaproteobacteria bacterium]